MSLHFKRSKILSQICQICGAPAEYSYFGAISCHPCKMFFRRNAGTKQVRMIDTSNLLFI